MDSKNYIDVLIGGKIYTLSAREEKGYLQQVAEYLNEKTVQIKKANGYSRMSEEYKNLTLCLNIADDYFKEREHCRALAGEKEELEKEVYRLKHELVNAQMKQEAHDKELKEAKEALEAAKKAQEKAEKELERFRKSGKKG